MEKEREKNAMHPLKTDKTYLTRTHTLIKEKWKFIRRHVEITFDKFNHKHAYALHINRKQESQQMRTQSLSNEIISFNKYQMKCVCMRARVCVWKTDEKPKKFLFEANIGKTTKNISKQTLKNTAGIFFWFKETEKHNET